MADLKLSLAPSEQYSALEALIDEAEIDAETRRGVRRARLRRGPRPPKVSRPARRARGRAPSRCVCPAHGTEFVRWVQSSLNLALSLSLPVNGVMDAATRSALREFQAQQGLAGDGIAGPETERALIEVKKQKPAAIGQAPAAQPEPPESTELEELESEINRTSSQYVKWVQRSLNDLLSLSLAVDGISGPATRSAVRSFQSRYGLSADGIVGPQTEAKMISLGASKPPGYLSPSYPAPSTPPTPGAGSNARPQLAAQILGTSRIELWPYSPTGGRTSDGADANSNIRDTAAGRTARLSAYGNAPGGSVYLDTRLLRGILDLVRTFSMRISSIAGGSHSVGSKHYAGIACDVDTINGTGVNSSNRFVGEFMRQCRALGATEVLGPGSSGHDTHVHFAWPRP